MLDHQMAECLVQLTQLTCLDIARVVAVDARSFPPSLKELKLHFEGGLYEDEPIVEVETWSNGIIEVTPDPEAWPAWWEGTKQLNLSHLRLLQRCELRLSRNEVDECGSFVAGDDDSEDGSIAVTLHLAAPGLTRLLINGNFGDVVGLQQPCGVQEFSLNGCHISTGRVAELVSGMPDLRDLRYDGREDDELEPAVCATPLEVKELPAALAAATGLTSLCLTNVGMRGSGAVGPGGDVDADQGVASKWGEHLQVLRQLQRLYMDFELSEADVLQLKALTGLTKLQVLT